MNIRYQIVVRKYIPKTNKQAARTVRTVRHYKSKMNNTAPSWTTKPARVQLQSADLKPSIPPQTGLTFNIWYNKWSQGTSSNNRKQRYVSPFRLDPIHDSGYTVGDKNGTKTYCLYFARGCCVLGSECEYLHHLPCQDIERLRGTESSSLSSSINSDARSRAYDCFGREKFAEYREDMGGVGSFQRENRSLYIGGLNGALPRSLSNVNDDGNNGHGAANVDSSKIEGRLRYLFSKFGELDRIRYIASKSCAFVKYRYVSDAEFAREATMNQTLLLPSDPDWESVDMTERTGLLVKWANEDPDPGAKRRKEEEDRQRTRELIKRLLLSEGGKSKAGIPTELDTTQNLLPSSSSSPLLDLWLHRHGGHNDGIRKRLIGQRITPEQFLQQYLETERQKPRMTVLSNTTTISNTINNSWRRTLNDLYGSSDDDDD